MSDMANQISFELDKSVEKQYWQDRLTLNSETASLSGFFAEDAGRNRAPAKHLEITLENDISEEINKLTKDSPILNYTVFLSVLNICLYKYSATRMISVGHPVLKSAGGQNQTEANLLIFQNDLNPQLTFKELLKQNQSYLKEDYARQNYTFDNLRKDYGLDEKNDLLRLLPCILTFDKVHAKIPDLKTPLKIRVSQLNAGFRMTFENEASFFQQSNVVRISRHFQNVLFQAIKNPDIRISEIILPDEEEQKLLIETFNRESKKYSEATAVHELFEQKAAEIPTSAAVNLAGFSLTYGELNERANQLANFLLNLGVKAEDNIGIAFERSIETVVSVLGVMKSGAAFLPVDLQNPAERLGYVLQDCGVEILLTKKPYFNFLSTVAPEIKIICLDEEIEKFDEQSSANPNIQVQNNQSVYTLYTSGSTGFPKGVVVEHGGLLNYVNWCLEKYPMRNQLTMLHSPLSFDLTITSIFPPLLTGKTIEVIPELPSIEGLAQSLSTANSYNLLKITPSHLQLLSGAMKKIPDKLNLDCLVIGGEALKKETISFWRENYPEIRCFNEYGPTETVVGCCVYEIDEEIQNNVPIGKPVYNQKLYVLDDYLNPLPQGIAGEIYISGKGLARGYNQKPDLTAERFLPNPFAETGGERMYRTGDIGKFNADLNLEYLGRIDNQVKIRGFRIELNEIEFNLSLFPDVLEATVAVKEDPQAQKCIVAYLVMEVEQTAPELKEVRQLLRQSLPEYMLPTAIVQLESLPLTKNGKVDTNSLPEPDWLGLSANRKNVVNITEDILLGIWREILGVSDISTEDNFFELGGHSLLATRVVARIREVWKTELEISQFFENPTIRAIGNWLENSLLGGETGKRPPIEKREFENGENKAALSYAQNRLWFLEQLTPGSPLYNVQLAIKLNGNLDISALQKSLHKVIERHEILRSSFVKEGDEAVQIVNELKTETELPVIELTGQKEQETLENIREILTGELRKGFDLTKGSLIRTILIKIAETEYVAVMTVHHLVFDGWSTAILVREIGEFYRAYTTKTKPNLPDLEIQYADFANWQRNWLHGEVLEKQLAYWRNQLAGIPAFLDLPTDKPRSLVQSINADVVNLKFDEKLVTALKKVSQNESATLFMTLMAGFRGLLYKYTGQNDILIGTPVAGRVSKELENLIGIFINNLVLRGFVEGKTIFSDLIKAERETALAAFSHQDVSWEKIVEDLNPDRNLSHPPIFQVMLILQNMAIGTLELGDITMSNVEIPLAGARYDLVLRLVEVSGQITCSVDYNSELFHQETINRFISNYRKLLIEVSENTGLKIADINLIDEKEREQIVYDWNDTKVAYEEDGFIHSTISQIARRRPENIAVKDATDFLTYGDLDKYSDRIAAHLRSKINGRETTVGICFNRSVKAIAAILGILKAGASYLPLDPDYPKQRLIYMIEDSETSLLITQAEIADSFKEAGCEILLFDSLIEQEADFQAVAYADKLKKENLAYLIYTSGSTGKPKGTMVSHRNLLQSTKARNLYYKTQSEVYLLLSSFSFDSSVAGIFWTLYEGGTLIIPPTGFEKDPEKIGQMIKEHQVTILLSLPSVYNFIISNTDRNALASLKIVIVAGETCPNEIVKKHHQLMPHAHLHNEYGPTEGSVWCSACELVETEADKNVSIGRPIPNSKVYILDENMQIVPPGVPGGIYIGGDGVTRGYYNRPELTAEKFLPDPFDRTGGRRVYRTGDIGRYRNDGSMEFRGREDEQIKIRGYRIELGEIESVIGEMEGIEECVVTVFRDSTDNQKLVGYFAGKNENVIQSESIRSYLKGKLPEYMIPQIIQKIERIPRLPNGKINRNALPKPEVSREHFNTTFLPPSNKNETFIAKIWADVLEIDRIGINDNFFDLGGHSFMIIKVHDQIQKQLNVSFPLIRLFEYTTVSSLAGFIDSQNTDPAKEKSYENWAEMRRKSMRSRVRL